jgi:hypothetical protein
MELDEQVSEDTPWVAKRAVEGLEKPDFEHYKGWLHEELRIEITKKTETYYNQVTNKIKIDFEKSDLWKKLKEDVVNFNEEYKIKTDNYSLLNDVVKMPEIKVKPFESFLLKTYRKNILNNVNWPNEPSGGWINPSNQLSRINDILRTRFVVKYIDGVDFLANKIESNCKQCGLHYRLDLEAKDEGYYAAHLYTFFNFEIPKITWDTEFVEISVEIQITTELQENIVNLLHKYYEDNRKKMKVEENWKWNYKSDEFAVNYLGHILHYIEGTIVEIRDKRRN